MPDSQRPTFAANCDYDRSDGEQAVMLAGAFYDEPLEWQRYVLDILLARDRRDKFQFPSVALSLPRQNGKSWLVRARVFYGMVAAGERILYTCQNSDTAEDMFRELLSPFQDQDETELGELLDRFKQANGQWSIYLKNGGFCKFNTRTNKYARGKSKIDVLIYDEAQFLTPSQQQASLPTVSAARTHNSQVIYLGTPPAPEDDGGVFSEMHARVHASDSGVAWVEWAADEVGDVSDRERWFRLNPSLPILLDESSVEREFNDMNATGFARERLGWWMPPPKEAEKAIPEKLWTETAIQAIGDRYKQKTVLAVKFTPDGSTYALAGCKLDKAGNAAFELVETQSTGGGTKELARRLAKAASQVSCVVIDGQNGAAALCDNLAELNVPRNYIIRPRATDIIAAAGLLMENLEAGTAVHTANEVLDGSALHSVRRPIGSRGGYGFGDSDGWDSAPIEACALGLFGARNSKRNPKRKQVVL